MSEITTRIEQYMQAYKDSHDRINSMDEKVYQPGLSQEEWLRVYKERSIAIREAFDENVRIIGEMDKILAAPLTEEVADTLYQQLRGLSLAEYDDPFYAIKFIEPLYAYYCVNHEYNGADALEREIFITQRLGYEYGMAGRMGLDSTGKAMACYKSVVEKKDRYATIEDAEYRYYFFAAYYNLINNSYSRGILTLEETAQYLEEMHQFWQSKTVQSLDGDNSKIANRVALAKKFWMAYVCDFMQVPYSDDCKRIYCFFADELWDEEQKRTGGEMLDICAEAIIAHARARLFKGELTYKEAVSEIVDYYVKRHFFLQAHPKNTGFVYDDDYMFEANVPEVLVNDWLPNEELDAETRKSLTRMLIQEKNRYILGLISRSESVLLNFILSQWDMIILNKLESRQEKEEALFNNIINRQVATYFHSHMVTCLTNIYMEAILRTAPQLLIGVRGTASREEVLDRKVELQQYARKCALYHDAGKNKIADIINMQSRKLTDAEFDVLKKHCGIGADMLDDDFAEYKDVIRGHHRFYNDKGGYPADFMTAESPVRILINMVTICDCIDAATDHLGRNYSIAKTFATVVEELRAGKGDRYNPELVELLDTDPYLYREMDDLITNQRENIYYNLSSTFTDRK